MDVVLAEGGFPWLSVLIFLPALGALALAWVPSEMRPVHRWTALGVSLANLLLTVPVWRAYDPQGPFFQLGEVSEGSVLGARYMLGIDGPALLLIALTTFLMPIVILSTFTAVKDRVREFMIALLMLETAMIGTFCALDLLVFYVFWEFMLIPMALLIGVWGSTARIRAAIKFVLYTLVGSLLMLVAIIWLHKEAGGDTFALTDLLGTKVKGTAQLWMFAAFALAFAIKVPFFPVHTWLPDAHTEAPTAGSVILAGVLLKMGTYGFYRFAIPLFPEAAGMLSSFIVVLAVIGIVYGALVAYAQADMKKLVAYSSVSHLGFVMLGMFALTPEGLTGSVLQMINHGISTGALFLLVGIIYERRHTRMISEYGGLAKTMPVFAAFFVIVTLSSIGLPGTNGFVGELLILVGAMGEALRSTVGGETGWRALIFTCTVLAATGVVLGAVYMLTLVRRVFFGPITNEKNKGLQDLNLREWVVLVPLVLLIFAIGIRPTWFTSKMEPSIRTYLSAYGPAVRKARDPDLRIVERVKAPGDIARNDQGGTDAP